MDHPQFETGPDKVLVKKDDAGPPAWELRYDDSDKTTILHRHDGSGVQTSFTDRGDGIWMATCPECGKSLEIRGTSVPHSE